MAMAKAVEEPMPYWPGESAPGGVRGSEQELGKGSDARGLAQRITRAGKRVENVRSRPLEVTLLLASAPASATRLKEWASGKANEALPPFIEKQPQALGGALACS